VPPREGKARQRERHAFVRAFPDGVTEELLVHAHGFDRAMISPLKRHPPITDHETDHLYRRAARTRGDLSPRHWLTQPSPRWTDRCLPVPARWEGERASTACIGNNGCSSMRATGVCLACVVQSASWRRAHRLKEKPRRLPVRSVRLWIKVRNPASIAVQRERSEKWNLRAAVSARRR
jgi:hypothetical protein